MSNFAVRVFAILPKASVKNATNFFIDIGNLVFMTFLFFKN